jgi:hypothetical protein
MHYTVVVKLRKRMEKLVCRFNYGGGNLGLKYTNVTMWLGSRDSS